MRRLASKDPLAGTGTKAKVTLPWFILFFCVAAALNSYVPRAAVLWGGLSHLGKTGLTHRLPWKKGALEWAKWLF